MDRVECEQKTLNRFCTQMRDLEEDVETKRGVICQVKVWTSLETGVTEVEMIIESNIISEFFKFLSGGQCDAKMLFDILWIAGNLCACSSDELRYMLAIGADDLFLDHLSHSLEPIAELAVWGIGNIADDSVMSRNDILKKGVIDKLSIVIRKSAKKLSGGGAPMSESFIKQLCWTTSQLVRGKPRPPARDVQDVTTIFREMIALGWADRVPDLLWGITYVTEEGKDIADYIARSNLLEKFTQLALPQQPFEIILPSLRIIGNLISCNGQLTSDRLFEFGFVQIIVDSFVEYNPDAIIIRKEACWCLSNIAAASVISARRLIAVASIGERLRRVLRQRIDPEAQREAMWIVVSLGKHCDESVFKYLVLSEILSIFATEVNSGDRKMIEVFLTSATYTTAFLLKAENDVFETQEQDHLVLLLHYYNTSLTNVQPAVVTGSIRNSCKQIKDDIERIKIKYALPKNLEEKLYKE